MKTALILFFITFFSVQLTAQWDKYPRPDEGFINGGLGLTWIDGKPHYRIAFRPEISFSDFGIGLDLNLDFDSEGKLRKENFNETSDYLSIIRYIRYGVKNDPVFIISKGASLLIYTRNILLLFREKQQNVVLSQNKEE